MSQFNKVAAAIIANNYMVMNESDEKMVRVEMIGKIGDKVIGIFPTAHSFRLQEIRVAMCKSTAYTVALPCQVGYVMPAQFGSIEKAVEAYNTEAVISGLEPILNVCPVQLAKITEDHNTTVKLGDEILSTMQRVAALQSEMILANELQIEKNAKFLEEMKEAITNQKAASEAIDAFLKTLD